MLTSVYNRNGIWWKKKCALKIEKFELNRLMRHYLIHDASYDIRFLAFLLPPIFIIRTQLVQHVNFIYVSILIIFDHLFWTFILIGFWMYMKKSRHFKLLYWISFELNRCIQTHFNDYLLNILWNISRRDGFQLNRNLKSKIGIIPSKNH